MSKAISQYHEVPVRNIVTPISISYDHIDLDIQRPAPPIPKSDRLNGTRRSRSRQWETDSRAFIAFSIKKFPAANFPNNIARGSHSSVAHLRIGRRLVRSISLRTLRLEPAIAPNLVESSLIQVHERKVVRD